MKKKNMKGQFSEWKWEYSSEKKGEDHSMKVNKAKFTLLK